MVAWIPVAWIVAIGGISGCMSTVPMHTAEPVPTGETDIAVAVGAHLEQSTHVPTVTPFVESIYPEVSLHVRRGLRGPVAVGGRISSVNLPPGGGVDLNWAVVDRPKVAVAINPTVLFGWAHLQDVSELFGAGLAFQTLGTVNLLVDAIRRERFTLTVAAKPGYFHSFGDSGSGVAFGVSVMAEVQTRAWFRLQPFVDVTGWRADGETLYGHLSTGVGFQF